MPELPEVETVVRTLAPHVTGARISRAEVLRASGIHPLSLPLQSLEGLQIAGVRRRGKLVLLDLTPESLITSAEAQENLSLASRPSLLAIHLRTGEDLAASFHTAKEMTDESSDRKYRPCAGR